MDAGIFSSNESDDEEDLQYALSLSRHEARISRQLSCDSMGCPSRPITELSQEVTR